MAKVSKMTTKFLNLFEVNKMTSKFFDLFKQPSMHCLKHNITMSKKL